MKVLNTTSGNEYSFLETIPKINFTDIFELQDIQRIQDKFSITSGVTSIITNTEGIPITHPSNLCRLYKDFIRKTDKKLTNCFKYHSIQGINDQSSPLLIKSQCGGLNHYCINIFADNLHIANWFICSAAQKEPDDNTFLNYIQDLGINTTDISDIIRDLPDISSVQFKVIANMLNTYANEITEKEYQISLLTKKNHENEKITIQLKESEEKYRKHLILIRMQ